MLTMSFCTDPAEVAGAVATSPNDASLPLTPNSTDTTLSLTTTNLKDSKIAFTMLSLLPTKLIVFAVVDPSALQPITLPVMNSLVSTNKVVVDANIDTDMIASEFPNDAVQNPLDFISKAEDHSGPHLKPLQVSAQPAVLPKIVSGPTYTEPMDCLPDGDQTSDSPMESATSPPTPMVVQQDDQEASGGMSKAESTTMICETNDQKGVPERPMGLGVPTGPLSVKDLTIICQLFYLPSDHGQFGLELLNEFYWLKRNGTAMLPQGNFRYHSFRGYCNIESVNPQVLLVLDPKKTETNGSNELLGSMEWSKK